MCKSFVTSWLGVCRSAATSRYSFKYFFAPRLQNFFFNVSHINPFPSELIRSSLRLSCPSRSTFRGHPRHCKVMSAVRRLYELIREHVWKIRMLFPLNILSEVVISHVCCTNVGSTWRQEICPQLAIVASCLLQVLQKSWLQPQSCRDHGLNGCDSLAHRKVAEACALPE